MWRRPRVGGRRSLVTLVLLYLLPGMLAALGALVALLSAERVTTAVLVLTVALIVSGFGVPPLADWLHGHHVRQVERHRLFARKRAEAEQLRAAQLRDHFVPRGRGVLPSSLRTASYFTGRVRVLNELAAWLNGNGSGGTGARVITGGPGSGKSAVLGRLVSLADPQLRASLPDPDIAGSPPGALVPLNPISAAVHARALTADEVATEIAGAFNVDQPSAAGLLAALRETPQPQPAVVVVDAIDEASDPYRLIVELLEPLASAAERSGIRLVIGTRRGGNDGLLRLFGSSAVVVDLDDPVYRDPRDIEEYVRRILLSEQDPQAATPYRQHPVLASAVAREVAARAGASFLVAQLTALALTTSKELVNTAVPGWAEAFPATVGAAMERYLREIQPEDRPLRDLLTALAWSEGDGLDDLHTWAAAATALGTAHYTEHDVAHLIRDTPAIDLLHRRDHGDRISFRLFHEALAEYLQQQSRQHRPAAQSQRRFTEVLMADIPRDASGGTGWSQASQYTRMYLPVHAAKGGVLDRLLNEAGFLATTEPARLLESLPSATTERGRQVARIIERVGQQLLVAPPSERVCYLEMAAHMAGDERLAQDLAAFAPDRPWSVLWAHWQALDHGRLLGHHDDYVNAVSAVNTPGGTVVVSASAWAVRAWRLADGTPFASGTTEPHAPINDMVAFPEGHDVIVVTLHADGELRRAVLGATAPTVVLATRRSRDHGIWLISHASQRAVVCTSADNNVEILSVADGHTIGQPPIVIGEGGILTAGNAGGRSLLVVSTPEAAVVTYDLTSGEPLGESLHPSEHIPEWEQTGPMWTAAVAEFDGNPIVHTAGPFSDPVVAWNPLRGGLAGLVHNTDGVLSIIASRLPSGEFVCWGTANGDLYVQASGESQPRRFAAHDNGVEALAACELAGNTVVISGGRDGAVRLWEIGSIPTGKHVNRYRSITLLPGGDASPRLVACIRPSDGLCRVLEINSGAIMAELAPREGARYEQVAALPGPVPTLVTVGLRGWTAVWQAPFDTPARTFEITPGAGVMSIAVTSGARPLLLQALTDGRLAFIDLASGEPARPPLSCHTSAFTLTLDPEPPDQTLRFITTTWNWRGPIEARCWTVGGDQATYHDLPLESDPLVHGRVGISQVAFSWLGSRRVAVAAGFASHIHVWDINDGSLVFHAQLLRAHRMSLNAIGVAELNNRTIALCAGYTCSLGLWPLASQEEYHLWVGTPLWSVQPLPGNRVILAGARGIMALQLTKTLPGNCPKESLNTSPEEAKETEEAEK